MKLRTHLLLLCIGLTLPVFLLWGGDSTPAAPTAAETFESVRAERDALKAENVSLRAELVATQRMLVQAEQARWAYAGQLLDLQEKAGKK